MSVLRGQNLRLFLTKSLTKSKHQKFSILLLIGLVAAIACSTQFVWSGFAARRSQTDKLDVRPASFEKLPPVSTRGPLKSTNTSPRYSSFQAAPFQGCTVNCTATVPATGQSGAGVSFQASATATGCSTQPAYQWSFGDGTPNSNEQNPSHTYASAGVYTWTLNTTVGGGSTMIDTVAGGLGEGNPARQSPFGTVAAIARDSQNRGLYVADTIGSGTLIRFVNTSASAVTIAGRTIAPGAVRAIGGGGFDISDNIPALNAELGTVTGLAASGDGNLLYLVNQTDAVVRAINLSGASQTVGSQTVAAGGIGTLAIGFGTALSGIAVNASTGEVFVSDATTGSNKVFRITPQGQSSAFAGNGAATKADDAFSAGAALSIPLLQPRAVQVEASGNVLVADTGHGRVIRVGGGNATLVHQFTVNQTNLNPFPSGIATFGGNAYIANGNQQTIVRVTGGVTTIAGTAGTSCDYTASSCGDGGPAGSSAFNMLGSTANPPVAGIASDASGLYVLDQGVNGRGRIRYINLTGGPVNMAGTNVPGGAIETIGGTGLTAPYDGGLATGATFNTPTGVAVDGSGNLWISDTISAKLRFANRATSPATIFSGTPAQQVVPPGGIVSVNKDVGAGAGDGVPVNQAAFDSPQGLFITSQGVYIADSKSGPSVPPQQFTGRRTSLIRFINTSSANVTLFGGSSSPIVVPPGSIMKIAGGSENSVPGDGGFATDARFIGASDLVVTSNGTIYVADVGQKAVRRIDGSTGVVSSVGSLGSKQFTGLGLDGQGRLHVANYDDGTVLRENSAGSGTFTTIASSLRRPRDVAVTSDGTAYVTVGLTTTGTGAVNNHQIVQITSGGAASVVGGSTAGFAGDGGLASAALLNISPSSLVVGSGTSNQLPETVGIVANGMEVLFTDSNNNRVRRISPSLTICTRTGTIMIGGDNPVPSIASLSPASANQNSGALTLTVNGTGLNPSSVVRWKGADRVTTFVSATQVTAQITAADIQTAGTAAVTVVNPAPGGGTSNPVNFNVVPLNPVPAISAINPNMAAEGSTGFTIAVNGSNFVNGSIVRWDGQNRQTTYVSATQLTAQVLAADLVGPGIASVTVFNPTPGGGVSSTVNFTITSSQNPQPTLANITPSTVSAAAAPLNLSVTGNNFVSGSKVRWNGTELVTTFINATQLSAAVPASLLASVGTAQVTVFNPTPGGGTSVALTFTITAVNPNNPTIAGLNPAVAPVGGQGFNLIVTGINFVSGAKVRIGTSERATTFAGSTQLTAAILAGDIAAVGSFDITVLNPSISTASNAVKLDVVAPVTSVSAASFLGQQSIAAESIVAAFGTGLATGVEVASTTPLPTTLLGTQVKVKDAAGIERNAPLFFVAPMQINYQVPPGTGDGVATVTVVLNGRTVGAGSMTIAKVAPGLISQNSNGLGVAAAVALRVRGGAQTFDAVSRFDSGQNRFVPIPIDLGPDSDTVYLVLYGVGIRGRSGAQNISVNLGGTVKTLDPAKFEDGFAAPGFVGLDQVNVLLPRTLIGKGTMDLILTVDGKASNTVQIGVK